MESPHRTPDGGLGRLSRLRASEVSTTPTPPGVGAIVVGRERRAVVDVLVASVLFGGCNIAWRYGSGPAIAMVGFRVTIGAVIALMIAGNGRGGSWTAPLRVRSGRVAVVVSIAGLAVAGTMFRTLDGPLAGLALACVPAAALLVRDRSGRTAAAAALGSSAAAIVGLTVAAGDGGVDGVTWTGAVVAVLFVAIEVASLRTSELAVADGVDPMAIVSATMLGGAVILLPVGLAFGSRDPAILGGALVAAFVVALFATIGRVLRTAALPAAGVTATAASTQIAALVTAIGGVVLFSDHVTIVSVVCTIVAASLGALAVVEAARWRLSRDPELGAVLDRGHRWEDGREEGDHRADA